MNNMIKRFESLPAEVQVEIVRAIFIMSVSILICLSGLLFYYLEYKNERHEQKKKKG